MEFASEMKKYIERINQLIDEWEEFQNKCGKQQIARRIPNVGDPFYQPVTIYGTREPLPDQFVFLPEILSEFETLQNPTIQIISSLDEGYSGFDQYLENAKYRVINIEFNSEQEVRNYLNQKIEIQKSCLRNVSSTIQERLFSKRNDKTNNDENLRSWFHRHPFLTGVLASIIAALLIAAWNYRSRIFEFLAQAF